MIFKARNSYETCHRLVVYIIGWNSLQMKQKYSMNEIAQRLRIERIENTFL